MNRNKKMERPHLSDSPGLGEVIRFVEDLTRWIGPGFHPDTDMADYVTDAGEQSFSATVANGLNRDLCQARDTLEAASIDICAIALPVQRSLLSR